MVNLKINKQASLHVLHVVGRLTDSVFNFLAPASEALANAGYQQTVVMLDDPKYRHLQYKLPPEVHVEIVSIEDGERHPWIALYKLIAQLISENNFSAYHLHGFLAWAIGTRMGFLLPTKAQVFYSSHTSKKSAFFQPLQNMIGGVMSMLGTKHHQIIGNSKSHEQGVSKSLLGQRTTAFEGLVQDVFFNVAFQKSRRPLLVSGCPANNHRSVEMFCRLAVVMSPAQLNMSFNWIGFSDTASTARLKAANIGLMPSANSTEIATKLASAWVFVAATDTDEFPSMLAQAMAAGLPCVVLNTSQHADLIKHEHNGLVYSTEVEALTMVSRLIDNAALREKLGAQAKADALSRFSIKKHDAALIEAYTRHPSPKGVSDYFA